MIFMKLNFDKIESDLHNEIGLTSEEAKTFLLITTKGRMSVQEIADTLDVTKVAAEEAVKKLIELGAFIDMDDGTYEAMHPRFTAVNMYRRVCERNNIPLKKNNAVDNIGVALEEYYDDARTK